MGAPIAAVPLINAIVFASFQQARSLLVRGEDRPATAIEASLAGAFAGPEHTAVVGPIELVKCRLQVQSDYSGGGVIQCLKQILERDGVRGLGRGMAATIAREIPCYAAQFYTYERLRAAASDDGVGELGAVQQLVIGGLAGVACWAASYPQDVVKSLLQTDFDSGRFPRHRWLPDGGYLAAQREVVRRHGWRGMWRGFAPCAARAFPANAAGFFAYEAARRRIAQE